MNFNLPKIDQQRFTQMAAQIPEPIINQLIAQARAQGIPENQIQAGLNFIHNLK